MSSMYSDGARKRVTTEDADSPNDIEDVLTAPRIVPSFRSTRMSYSAVQYVSGCGS